MKKIFTLVFGLLLLSGSLPQALAQGITGKPVYRIETKRAGVTIGDITVELFPLIAPLHVANFDTLVAQQFYDSTAFHRVIPGFMIQGGDPNSRSGPRNTWGFGQPGQPTVNAEFSKISHVRGILSAARSANINSATSQFFIVVAPSTHLDGQYSAYGRVTAGMNVADNIVNSPRDANDNPIEKVEMFITRIGTNDSVPVAPTLLTPVDGFTSAQATQAVTWQKVPDAAIYSLQVSTDAGFGSLLVSEEIKQTAASFNVTGLQPQTTYYWRMRTNNGGYLSPWSTPRTFSTGLPGPTLVLPTNNYTGASTETVLEWASSTGADAYRVMVARSPLFTPSTMVLDTLGVNGQSLLVQNLLLNTKYYWRVQAVQSGSIGFFSPTWNFRVTVLGAEEEAANSNYLEVRPNPAASQASVAYSLKQTGDMQLCLLDLSGRLVSVIDAKHQLPGDYTASLNTSQLAPGVYLLQLTQGSAVANRKLVILK